MAIDLQRLKIFYAVAREQKISSAREILNISESAISRQITNLEDGLGIKVFHRHPRGLSLTESGKILYRASEDIVHRIMQVEEDLDISKNAPHGNLVLAAPMLLGTYCVLPWLYELRQAYAEINICLNMNEDNISVEPGKADALLSLYPSDSLDLIQIKLIDVHFGIYASQDYCKTHGYPKTANDLLNHQLIAYTGKYENGFKGVDNHIKLAKSVSNGQEISYHFACDHLLGILKSLENGHGIACLPNYAAYHDKNLVRLMPQHKIEVGHLYFVYPIELKNSRRIKILHEFLLEKFKNSDFNID